ncbi:MAG: polysaccharide biosynthesis protein [Candidatus Thiodiazotropha sp. (ex Monitilora ramsayi)]|nr:polysaccharide biosynthesis protein [Candidatus Thiodiazotropha sp. (ex Monitilora ramsayi)]
MFYNKIPARFRSQGAALAHDLLSVPITWCLAYWLRLETFTPEFIDSMLNSLLVIVPIQLAAFILFGLYRGIWRYASLPDLQRIIKAVFAGTAVALLVLFLLTRLEGIPRSVPIIYTLLLLALLGGSRLLYRWAKDHHLNLSAGKRVLIVGAGKAGEMLARDLLRHAGQSYHLIAFVDDNQRRQGREIHGIPIAGFCRDIYRLVQEREIDIIMLAIPSANPTQFRQIVAYCDEASVPYRTVPQLTDLMTGNVHINDLREVSIDDLLGREPVSLDWPAITRTLAKKRILITGGGGSIGSELCRQVSQLNPQTLIIVENSELHLYTIEMELRQTFPKLDLRCHLGDVIDHSFLEAVFQDQRPEVVFHAAAYKHVPLLEPQLRQAIRNNVLGTRVVAQAADRHGCENFVLVSTDKAVNPANVMGASKRAAEIFCQNLNAHSQTRFITVRFGNVLGSAGSVIPLFRKQIESGGPVTVTDPRMERYFMTIPEACQLIMQTVVLGQGGEIFVLDMGEPVKISYLAEQMIRLSGRTPGEDIAIDYIGLRPGEKLFEELFHEKEQLEKTGHEKVFLARHRSVDWSWLNQTLDQITVACEAVDTDQLNKLLDLLVPEHRDTKDKSTKAVKSI